MNAVLVCATCGEKRKIEIDNLFTLGVDLHSVAELAGMKPKFDFNRSRVLIFCSEECAEKQLTKTGVFRKRLIKCRTEY